MQARLLQFIQYLKDTFWILPAAMVLTGFLLAQIAVHVETRELIPDWLLKEWLYGGGDAGARALLGAIASSTIGVAGTVFSITIAALSLASSQMGPRLLRNFTKDRGNQATLGLFLGTFAYALTALRSIRGSQGDTFVPHLATTLAMLLAFGCIGMLVFFVHHVASRINVGTVVDLVHADLSHSVNRLTDDERWPDPPHAALFRDGQLIRDPRTGYLQQLDDDWLADWAHDHGTLIRLLVRPGDFVYPDAVIAIVAPPVAGAEAAIRNASALGAQPDAVVDLEFSVRQLVEVAVRALSPGINDPQTAMTVLERLGATLCDIASCHLPSGVFMRGERTGMVRSAVNYAGLTDSMFGMIRQNAADSPAVLIRMLDVLRHVATCERRPERLAELRRHALMVLADGRRGIANENDVADLEDRFRRLDRLIAEGPGVLLEQAGA